MRKPTLWLAAIAAWVVALALYLLRLDRVVGLIVDDAWYVMLAKALATGQGFTLINSPTPGIVPFYPPGFPALLSLVVRLAPDFPDNIAWLKSVSIAAMFGAGIVAFRYFTEQRALPVAAAFLLAFATAIYPALVFLATSSVMSECVFTFAQLAAIFWIEQAARRDAGERAPGRRDVAVGAALASFAFVTRPAGLGLLVGAGLYLLLRRRIERALIFAALVALLAGPWMLYSRSHVPTPEQRVEQSGGIVLPYTTQFWQRVAGRQQSGQIGWADLPERIRGNLVEIGKVDLGAFVFYSAYRPMEPGDEMSISDRATWVSLGFALLALVGYVAAVRERVTLAELVVPLALAVTLTWGWEQYRLLLPLTPFVFFYLSIGVRALLRACRTRFAFPGPRAEAAVLTAVASVFVVSALDGNLRYLQRKLDPQRGSSWIRAFEENEAFIRRVGREVPLDQTIATQNPALFHLYTGHKTIASNDPRTRWRVWKRLGVRYVAKTSPYPVELDANEVQFRTVFVEDGQLGLRLFDLGPPETRRVD